MTKKSHNICIKFIKENKSKIEKEICNLCIKFGHLNMIECIGNGYKINENKLKKFDIKTGEIKTYSNGAPINDSIENILAERWNSLDKTEKDKYHIK